MRGGVAARSAPARGVGRVGPRLEHQARRRVEFPGDHQDAVITRQRRPWLRPSLVSFELAGLAETTNGPARFRPASHGKIGRGAGQSRRYGQLGMACRRSLKLRQWSRPSVQPAFCAQLVAKPTMMSVTVNSSADHERCLLEVSVQHLERLASLLGILLEHRRQRRSSG